MEPISPEFTILQKFLGLWYPIMNIVSIIFIGLIFLKFKGGKISSVYIFLIFSFIALIIGDIWYALLEILDLYRAYHPVDLFWCLGYLLIGLGGFYQYFLLKTEEF